jgi:hypothetical protein
MTRIRNHKTDTVLVAISVLASLLTVSGHIVFAVNDDDTKVSNTNYGKHHGGGSSGGGSSGGGSSGGGSSGGGSSGGGSSGGGSSGGGSSSSNPGNSVSVDGSNTGINVSTDTDQKQNCETAGGGSTMTGSCTASSTDTVTQSGGVLKK